VFSLPDCASQLSALLINSDPSSKVTGISIDTRTLAAGDFFIALRGAHTDGHEYVIQAMTKGASGAIVDRHFWKQRTEALSGDLSVRNLIVVPETKEALVILASWHRSRLEIPFAGITGSVGKTSTKEFLSYLAGCFYTPQSVLSTRGNFNNELGLPLTLLDLTLAHRFAAAELGAGKKGDIRYLCDILKPTAGILTCVAPSHMQSFGSLDGIYQTKLELFESLPEGGIAVIPDDDPTLLSRSEKMPIRHVTVGLSDKATYKVSEVKSVLGKTAFSFAFGGAKRRFEFPGSAPFMAMNAAFALALLHEMGEDLNKLPSFWSDFELPPGRFSLLSLGEGITAVFDGYNASPRSFQRAVESFSALADGARRIIVAGDMLELGEGARTYHEELGEYMGSSGIDALFAYGPLSAGTARSASNKSREIHVYHSGNIDDIMNPLMEYLRPGDYVLLKASRGMRVEKILEALKKRYPPENQIPRSASAASLREQS